ncbi:PQQ-dependent sugar dehydrogenase [Novosphingobium sp.]|uniref:PQQ-dependent sugar dehydrogenase n=1 Tax=Novosphingobium sp. TaxID=1874826 RepID=UPI001EB1DCDF|nr:PQQ-dependent sugar dehydrogenase [Novosphingobium sp.]MBK6802881.1 sorbosone dehydrogenase family protein [Novosphingobium sp.]MBK9012271.1 sorbosone dehydrogenase family protein [Novosphingobium sp.]
MSTKRKLLVALGVFLLVIAGLVFWVWRGVPAEHTLEQLSGKDPVIAEPKEETIPSVRIATPIGWAAGEAPETAKGLTVGRFAEGLDHPRVIHTLPNGDVIVAEADAPEGSMGSGLVAVVGKWLMERAGARGESADRLVLLRDADGDGRAEARFTLREKNGLASPSGLAWAADTLYVANHDAVLAFPYKLGETAITAAPEKLMDLPAGGNHWMRNLLLSEDGKRLYVAVGSASNIGENGMEIEKGRAAIWELTLGSGKYPRQFAQGLRNPNGLAWNPSSGELWTTVNERDMLGPDLVPDYLTNVPVGAHYGWPWVYWKKYDDDRVDALPPEFLDDFVRKPEYAMGAHTASLGLAFVRGGERMGADFANGAFIARHGSWNRKPLSGYDVVFVRFDANGNPQGLPVPVLTGFLNGEGQTRGRPTWVAFDKGGALLVSDDTAGIIWRAVAPGAAPAAAVKPVVTARMPPQRSLEGDPNARFSAGFRKDDKGQ